MINKKKKTKKRVINYEIEEFIYGRIDHVTDCPFGELGRYTMNVNKVGDLGCNTCKWQVSHNPRMQQVVCSYQAEEKKKRPLFNI